MHFIVANIVTPLTSQRQTSFVGLWGGRKVDYFVCLWSGSDMFLLSAGKTKPKPLANSV